MIELVRFNLRDRDEWDDFYALFTSYLRVVCSEEEYRENIEDLHNDELNAQLIEQTLQTHNPYFIMRIVAGEGCLGFVSYSYNEERDKGFINNFFVVEEHRNLGVGSAVYRMVESHLGTLGARRIECNPVKKAEHFYIRNGFAFSHIASDGERVFYKEIG